MQNQAPIHFYLTTRKKTTMGPLQISICKVKDFMARIDWPLACKVAEAVSLKMRKGKILNSKGDFHSPPLIEIQRTIRRGIGI